MSVRARNTKPVAIASFHPCSEEKPSFLAIYNGTDRGTGDKRIRLTEDAYEALERCTRTDETVSEAIERLAGGRPISDLAGLFTDAEVAEIRTARTKRSETDADRRERE